MQHHDVIAIREVTIDLLMAAINDRDLSRVGQVFTEDAVYELVPTEEEFVGVRAIEEALGVFFEAFPDMYMEKRRTIVTATQAVIEWDFTGTMVRAIHGIGSPLPPYKVMKKPGVIIVEFTPEARIRRWTEYWDLATAQRQIHGD